MMIRVKRQADKVELLMMGVIEPWDLSEVAWIVFEAGDLPIELHLDSPGGSPKTALSIARLLALHPAGYTCIVEGNCLSAAPLIAFQAPKGKLKAIETAIFMFHGAMFEPYNSLKEQDLIDSAEMVRVTNTQMAVVIAARSGQTDEEVKELLKGEVWMTAKEAFAKNYIDEVVAIPRTLPAQPFNLAAHFKDVPATIQALLPVNPNPQSKTTMKSFLDRAKAMFSLGADADEVDAAQKLAELKAKADAADAAQLDLTAANAEIVRLKAQVEAAAPKPDAVDAELTQLVETAVSKFQVKASDKDVLIAKYKGNIAGFKEVLAFVPEGAHKPGMAPRAPGKNVQANAHSRLNPTVAADLGVK